MMFVTGDYHSGFDADDRFEPWNFHEGTELARGDYIFVTGDFGVPSDGYANSSELRAFRHYPWSTLFVDGNHEDFGLLEEMPVTEWHGGKVHRYHNAPIIHLMRGQVYEFGNMRLFTMGGAKSVVAGDKVWAQEMPTDDEYDEAIKNLERVNWQVDYVITHACPSRFLSAALGWEGGYHGAIPDDLTDFLDTVWTNITLFGKGRLKRWYCGHYHNETNIAGTGNKIVCLYHSVIPLGETL